MNKKNLIIGVIALIVIVAGYFVFSSARGVGGTTNFDTLDVDSVIVGENGSTLNEIKSTTCNLSTTATSLASSTSPFQCAITGIASGDQVFVTLPYGNSMSGLGGIAMRYAVASTTAGFIEVGLFNASGVATTSYALATTSVQVLYLDN